jgi:biopolymer transport protein ExbD
MSPFRIAIGIAALAVILSGCTTSTVITDPRRPEIRITASGEILFHEEIITKEQIPLVLKERGIDQTQTILMRVPSEQTQRDHLLMRAITDTLRRAGYSKIVFATEKKATANLKESATRQR